VAAAAERPSGTRDLGRLQAGAADPRGYHPVGPAGFLTAIKFINALREVNITVHRAARVRCRGRDVSRGSFVVMTAQAFRPHVLDMFEPQDHPNVIPYPGAPPTPPYDNAGWTLAYQMGIAFDRVLEPFSGPFERVADWNVPVPPGRVTTASGAEAYRIDRRINDAYRAVNRLLAQGAGLGRWGCFYVSARLLPRATAANRQRPRRQRGGCAVRPGLSVCARRGSACGSIRRIDEPAGTRWIRAVRVPVRARVASARCRQRTRLRR
jgi:hypothetical protein